MKRIVLTMTGSAVQLSSGFERAGQVCIQNRGNNNVYVSDSSSATTAQSVFIASGGSINWTVPTMLSSWYFNGTSGDTVVALYD